MINCFTPFLSLILILIGFPSAISTATAKVGEAGCPGIDEFKWLSYKTNDQKLRGVATADPLLCLIVKTYQTGEKGQQDSLTCDLIQPRKGNVAFGLTIEIPKHIVDESNEALHRGEWFVSLIGATVVNTYIEGHGQVSTGIAIYPETIFATVSPIDGEMALLSAKGTPLTLGERRQLQTKGMRTVLVLRVSVSDSSPSISASRLDEVFFDGTNSSLVSQYHGCSFGAIQFQAYDNAHPVIDVMIQGSAASFTSSNLWPIAMEAGATLKNVKYLFDLAQHVAIVLPPGLSDSSGWYASGVLGSWRSIFNDFWSGYPTFPVHEMGHNLGLGHSGVGNDPYADESDVMGYGDTQLLGVAKCFNGYHFWYLNWFASRSTTVDPYTHTLLTLAAFADFDKTTADQYVVIRVDPYYLVYNRAKGVNAGVVDVPNTVTVTQSQPSVFSLRVAALDQQTSVFRVSNYDGGSQSLIVQVCSVVNGGGGVDYAIVSIGVGVPTCSGDILSTQATSMPSYLSLTAPTPPPTQHPSTHPILAITAAPVPPYKVLPSFKPMLSKRRRPGAHRHKPFIPVIPTSSPT